MRICFLDYFTEAHPPSHPEYGQALARELESFGHEVVALPDDRCDVLIAGGISRMETVYELLGNPPRIPVINYNWDLYSWIWTHPHGKRRDWKRYGELLRQSADVWVPSACTAARTKEYYGVNATVLKTSVHPYKVRVHDGGYVVDVMRRYSDPAVDWIERACKELNIPCRVPNHQLSWPQFTALVGGARVLTCAFSEASTGGLSLLEGHYHGKNVLLSNSPYNGGVDYFGGRANYFQHGDFDDLKGVLKRLWSDPPALDRDECRGWVEANYSERAFAERIHNRLMELRL